MAVPQPNNTTKVKTVPAPKTGTSSAPPVPRSGSPAATTPKPTASVPAPKDPFEQFGGRDAYITSQNQRWMEANRAGDTDLMRRLQDDAKRVGYELKPYTATPPASSAQPAQPTPSTPTRPNVPAPVSVPSPALSPEYADWKARMDKALATYESLAAQPFNYNPESDPAFQAMQTLARQRAQGATQSTLEEMNARGILGSSVTASQLAQIQQQAEQEALQYIPQFREEARRDYQDRLARAAEMLRFAADRGDVAYGRAYQEGRDVRRDFESDRAFDRGVLESDRTFERGVLESDRAFDRGVLESDRAFERGVLESDREFTEGARRFDATLDLQERQFQESIRQFGVEKALQREGMLQEAQRFAAQMGYNWASLNQREKERIADEVYRNRQLDLQERELELDLRREDRLLAESQAPQGSDLDPVVNRALDLASKDPQFPYMSPAERQQLIDFYIGQLRPGPTYGPPVPAMTDEELLQYLR